MTVRRKIAIELDADLWLQFLCAIEGNKQSWQVLEKYDISRPNKDADAILDVVSDEIEKQLCSNLTLNEVNILTK